MSLLQNSNAISSGSYDINNSLRFRSSASAYLNRTLTAPTLNTKWTWSAWVKLGTIGADQDFFIGGSSSNGALIYLRTVSGVGTLAFYQGVSGNFIDIYSTDVLRDPSAWYHLVVSVDLSQSGASKVKFYKNGTQMGSTVATNTITTSLINSATSHSIGGNWTGYFNGYMTEVNFIDGQALTPSSFGETDSTTGVWKPKAYTGTYGTNGFYLKFSDIATTSGSNAGLGKDFSGNTNYWTTNNISVTAGTTYDAMIDSPTNASSGTRPVGNYAVANPLDKSTNVTVTNGNMTVSTAVTNAGIRGSMYVSSGKYYWEATCTTKTNYPNLGIADAAWGLTNVGSTSGSYGYATDGLKYNNGSTASYGATYTNGDVIGVALDLDAGTLVFYKNNTSQGTAYSSLSGTFAPAFAGQASDVWNVNFGQRPFAYTPPTGYQALCTTNLPTPTILQGNKYMDATLYTGTGSSLSVTNAGAFKPDFVWAKNRGVATSHRLFDSVRGVQKALYSNLTNAEATESDSLTAFNSNGFSLGADTVGGGVNSNGSSYVAWQWQAGQGTTSSNTSGSITSTVSVNTTAGFSVVTYTGTGANATVGHGLGVAPRMMIIKCRSAAGDNWRVYHASLGATKFLDLNQTSAVGTATSVWNDTAPTSTVWTVGTNGEVNRNTSTYVGYIWAEIAGFSAFGSYTGNGSADGPMIFTGFLPKFIMFKRTNDVSDWNILDTTRSPYNTSITRLFANVSNAENSSAGNYDIDILSNGFKQRNTNTSTASNSNINGSTYIYMAFASDPFSSNNRAR